ncbi:tRNA lysidine(34) synthetase TilS [Thiovibrio sp. JS02]
MHPLARRVKKIIRSQNLLVAGERCLVGVSGGPDSMALLHLLAGLAEELSVSLIVAHADHGLRPGEASAEAALVRAAAEGLVCPYVSRALAVKAFAEKEGLSVEHAARTLRYAFFSEMAVKEGASKIAVAHTADDQAEEILLRLLRGAGRAGLAGMVPMRAGLVIRPLLGVAKEELLGYLAACRIPYCLDSSNRERVYLRNRVRLDLLPHLKEHFNPGIEASLRRTAAVLAAEEELLVRLTDQAYAATVAETGGEPPVATLALPPFAGEPLALQRRILEKICWQMECRPSFAKIGQLLHLALAGGEGALLHLARGLRAQRESGRLVFFYPQGKIAARGNLLVRESPSFFLHVPGPGEYPVEAIGKKIVVEEVAGLPTDRSASGRKAQWLDADSLVLPLSVRSFLPGDRFRPQGAPGHKKVGDFFTDHKIPAALRRQTPVLVDREGIVALLGLRSDQRCAATEASKRVLVVRIQAL